MLVGVVYQEKAQITAANAGRTSLLQSDIGGPAWVLSVLRGILAMRFLVRIGSVVVGIAYLALLVVAHRVGSLSDGSGAGPSKAADLLLVYPLVYLGICFYTSFALQKGRNLLILGSSANALLIALGIGMCFMGPTGWAVLFPVSICVCLWTFMYVGLDAPYTA